jgi:HSP20 family protein
MSPDGQYAARRLIMAEGLALWKRQEMDKIRRDLETLCERFWNDLGMSPLPVAAQKPFPSIDLAETEGELIIHAEIPGVEPEDLDISAKDDILTISGTTSTDMETDTGDIHRIERRYGTFSRTLRLPCRVTLEKADASYRKGILTIILPKRRPETAKEIKIRINRNR